jgi:putative membrane protein
MKHFAVLSLLAGLALAIFLVVWHGVGDIAEVLATGGWPLLLLAPYYLVTLIPDTLSWQSLLPAVRSPRVSRFPTLLYANWVGSAINWLLPVAQVGGEVVRVRILMRHGVRGADAGASIVVDKTVQALTLVLLTILGLLLLAGRVDDLPLNGGIVAFAVLLTAGILIFWALQHRGLFGFLAQVAPAERWSRWVERADALDGAIRERYRELPQFCAALAWRVFNRLIMAGEVYLALYLLGQPVAVVDSIILQSLGQAVRSAAFLVPGAIGVQEGGYLVLGLALGITPEVGLAVSLAKRLRELVVGLPGLVAWQYFEVRRWHRDRRQPTPA